MADKTCDEVLEALKALGDERAVRIWEKLGMDPAHYWGVNLTKVKALAKTLGRSQELADALWETGIHDARLLATCIGEPRRFSREQADRWVRQAAFWDLSDKLCTHLVVRTPFAKEAMTAWMESQEEFVRRSGFIVLAGLADSEQLSETELLGYLQVIEAQIQTAPNWIEEAMNTALIAIGKRSRAMNTAALAVVERIGKVVVDYGETSCKTPDAAAYLTRPAVTAKWT